MYRQHHAAIRQWQGCIANQKAGVPHPRQGQHAHRLKGQILQAIARAALAQVQNPRSRPAAAARRHHKDMDAALAIQPGDRVTQPANAKTQLRAGDKTVDHKSRGDHWCVARRYCEAAICTLGPLSRSPENQNTVSAAA
ncbi:MAG: hypothetical protein IPG23_07115 [Burkholderiales bacterium]|nr:hypothetical protein [Burkholderiales bacterium]